MTHHGPILPAAQQRAEPHPADIDRQGDRWTAPKMADFLRQLSASHSVSAAARSVGMSRQSAYRLRSRLKGQAFDLAWDVAFHHSYDNLAHAALERALNGVEIPVFFKGEQVGSYRRFDERLTVALLALSTQRGNVPLMGRRAPEAECHAGRFEALVAEVAGGADGDGPVGDPGPVEQGEVARIHSAGVSPWSDADLMAGLRAVYGGDAG
ncbi:MAG: hypothetical protein P0Y56_13630 [Candidatus Andeanibacterium colombiense]|uniref:LysR family transcriptional regulator n=1 Tax=Candidatus Andeanibacterium colombiense TaxID=3121345 RepID=A0AAJ5X7J8_9SPHN|nr:MAG: hypothetical protein P0Y56_13630 [Sphingomonadaceae bacterium]